MCTPPKPPHDFAQWLLEALVSRAAPPAVRRAVRVAQHLHQDRRSGAVAKKTGVHSRPSYHTRTCACALPTACLTPPSASRLLFDTAACSMGLPAAVPGLPLHDFFASSNADSQRRSDMQPNACGCRCM